MSITAGIDLGGYSNLRKTSLVIFNGREFIPIRERLSDISIYKNLKNSQVEVVAIDAPLSKPIKRSLRESDFMLKKLIKKTPYPQFAQKILPPLSPYMKVITERGIKLAREIQRQKIRVIETHPTISLYFHFLSAGKNNRISALIKYKKKTLPVEERRGYLKILSSFFKENFLSDHEFDAGICAWVGYNFLKHPERTILLTKTKSPFVVIKPLL